ncbi:disulfide bond formation protein B [Alphaproteobacteria bacterium]|nr:disulfide bond formation protein B [Alphaproteobacteria bacterium]
MANRLNQILLLCALGSAGLLIGAFLFEYVAGLAPCKLCIWQRWAHVAVVAVALLGFTKMPRKFVLALVADAALISALIAGYHAGVEWQFWDGPSGCTANLGGSMSASDMVDQLLATPVIQCDEVAWSLFGLSMAGWNMLASIGIAALAIIGISRRQSV